MSKNKPSTLTAMLSHRAEKERAKEQLMWRFMHSDMSVDAFNRANAQIDKEYRESVKSLRAERAKMTSFII